MQNEVTDTERRRHFTERFVRYQHRVYAFIVTLLPDRNEAEEVLQETSLLLWENWEKFDLNREFVPWACGFAFNVVRNRRKKRQPTTALSDDLLAVVADTRQKTEELLELRRQALSECLGRLDSDQRHLIRQCYWESDKLKTAAAKLKLAPATLYKRLERIRRDLFECINARLTEEGHA